MNLRNITFIALTFFSLPVLCDSYIVKPGDTLTGIASRLIDQNSSDKSLNIKSMMSQIMAQNPEHFSDHSSHQLSQGMELQLPEIKPQAVKVAVVESITGSTWRIDTSENRKALSLQMPVYSKDVLMTGEDSRLELTFTDQSKIYLKSDAKIAIDQYEWNQKSSIGQSFIHFLKGSFRAITGLIVKNQPENYQIKTPVATLGMRGTDFGSRICTLDSCQIQKNGNTQTLHEGVYTGVLDGEIVSSSAGQSTAIKTGQVIFQKDEITAPQQVENIPGLLFSADEIALYQPTPEPFYEAFWLDREGKIMRNLRGECIRSMDYRADHNVAECME